MNAQELIVLLENNIKSTQKVIDALKAALPFRYFVHTAPDDEWTEIAFLEIKGDDSSSKITMKDGSVRAYHCKLSFALSSFELREVSVKEATSRLFENQSARYFIYHDTSLGSWPYTAYVCVEAGKSHVMRKNGNVECQGEWTVDYCLSRNGASSSIPMKEISAIQARRRISS